MDLTVQKDGDPAFFLTAGNPKTETAFAISSGSVTLELGEEHDGEGRHLRRCIQLCDSAMVSFMADNGQMRVFLNAKQSKGLGSNIALLDKRGNLRINLIFDDAGQLPHLSLADRNSIPKTGLLIGPTGDPSFNFGGSDQRPALVLDLDAAGTPKITLYDRENNRVRFVK